MKRKSISLLTLPPHLAPSDSQTRSTFTAEDARRWHEQHLDSVYAYVLRRVASRSEAEDVTAEVFAAVCQPSARLSLSAAVSPLVFLFGIARRKIADANRKRRWREIPLSQLFHPEQQQRVEETPTQDLHPEAQLLQWERAKEIRTLLSTLKEEQREALLLHYVESLTIAEAAHIMQKSVAAVNSLLQRGRETLFRRGKTYFYNEDALPTTVGHSPKEN